MAVHGCSPSCLSPDAFEAPFPQRSRPRLLTDAACGGLRPAPASRSRGTYPHLSRRLLRHTDVGDLWRDKTLQRNLLYTGVTRGKRLVVLVGQKKAVAIAVRNVSGRRRWSKLGEWLGHSPPG